MNILASIICPSVSSMKNAINSVRQLGHAAALAWPEWFQLSKQFEWKIWLQWVWIRLPTAAWFRIQGWIQIEQSISEKTLILLNERNVFVRIISLSTLYISASSSKILASDSHNISNPFRFLPKSFAAKIKYVELSYPYTCKLRDRKIIFNVN